MQFERVYDLSQKQEFSPSVVLDALKTQRGQVFAVREDLLPGGTKQRAVFPLLNALRVKGFDHFIYASPFSGYAQVALAYVCRVLKVSCTIYAERDPHTDKIHEFSRLAEKNGARVFLSSTLKESEQRAEDFAIARANFYKVPLGFNTPEYRTLMQRELEKSWSEVLRHLGGQSPRNLWLPVGSGVLTQVFSKVVDKSVRLRCVDVHVLGDSDSRIQALRKLKQVELISCPQAFAERALRSPSIPSNVHYDAKLWDIIERQADDGDVWWNVAR